MPATTGLNVMDGPGFSPESIAGFAAAVARLTLFASGAGSGDRSLLAATIKISTHPHASHRTEHIDFDASGLWRAERTMPETADALVAHLVEAASDLSIWGKIVGEGSEAFARLGGSF